MMQRPHFKAVTSQNILELQYVARSFHLTHKPILPIVSLVYPPKSKF